MQTLPTMKTGVSNLVVATGCALTHLIYAHLSLSQQLEAARAGMVNPMVHGLNIVLLDLPVSLPVLISFRLFGLELSSARPAMLSTFDAWMIVLGTAYWFVAGYALSRLPRLMGLCSWHALRPCGFILTMATIAMWLTAWLVVQSGWLALLAALGALPPLIAIMSLMATCTTHHHTLSR